MSIRIGIENNYEGRSLAWALEHPGCFAYGANGEMALAAMPEAIADYAIWIANRNAGESWVDLNAIELYLEESFDDYSINEEFDLVESGYEVDAWYHHDWKPLTEMDVERGLKLLEWTRADLLDVVEDVDQKVMEAFLPGERWNILGILKHVAGADWWYLDKLGLALPREQIPEDPYDRLEVVRDTLLAALPQWIGVKSVVGELGEFWSPRKVLRRAVWHERDHTWHILRLRDGL